MSAIRRLHILILEDNPIDADLLNDALAQAGFEFDSLRVDNETDFINQLNDNVDLILADYALPRFNALQALQLLQSRGLDIPFIVVTGAVSEETAVECIKQGAADYLLKDRLTRLGQAVVRALEDKRLREEKRKAEEHVHKLNRTLTVLSDVNQAIVRTRSISALFEQVCRIAVEQGGFRLAWIGLPDSVARSGITTAAHAGTDEGYMEKLALVLSDEPHGFGPTASAWRTGEHAFVNDIERDPRMAPLREDALRLGFRAVATFPLKIGGEVRGSFTMYADTPGFFDDDEFKLLDEMAADISFAMEFAEQEEHRQKAEVALRLHVQAIEEMRVFLQTTLDAFPANTVVLDADGTIINVNLAWVRFTDENDAPSELHYLGTNYLTVCDTASGLWSEEAAPAGSSIRAVIAGSKDEFSLEYPCHSPSKKRWFQMRVTPFPEPAPRRVVVAHINITERKRGEEALRQSEAAEHAQRILAETLRDTAEALVRSLDPDVVMAHILQNISRVVPHDSCNIMLIRGDTAQVVYYQGSTPAEEAAIRAIDFPLDTPNLREMIRTRAPVFISNTTTEPGWILPAWPTRSYVGAPIQIHGNVIGFLSVDSNQPGFYTARHAERLGAFASQAAVAIENAQLYTELQHYARQLEQRVDERTIDLQRAKEHVEAILNSSADGIILADSINGIQQTNPAFDALFACPPDDYLSMPLTALVVPEDAPHLQEVLLATTHGVVNRLEIRAPRRDGTIFAAEIGLAPVLDKQTASGKVVCVLRDITEQKRAAEILEKRNRTLTTLHGGALEVGAELDVSTLLPRIMQRAVDLLSAERGGGIYLYDREQNALRLEAGTGINASRVGITLRPDEGVAGRVLQSGQPLIVNDYTHWDGRATVLVPDPPSAVMGVPLFIQGQVAGALLVMANSQERTFASDDAHVAEMFAAQAAIALHNAQLYSAAQREIAERKQTEEALRESEWRYRSLFDNMLNGFAYCKMLFDQGRPQDFLYLEVNRAFETLTGLRNVVGQKGSEAIPRIRDTDRELLERYGRVALTGQPETFEIYVDGLAMWLSVSVYSPEKEYFVVVFDVITERKQRERQLRYYASLQENVSDAVISADLEFRIQSWNQAAERIYGWSAEEATGKILAELLQTSYESDQERERIVQAFLTQGHWEREFTQRRKDGSEVHILGSTNLLRDERGVPFGIVALSHDITERKRAEEALKAKLDEEREFQGYLRALHEITIELAQVDQLDEFYRRTVELGLQRLGIERLSLFLYDAQNNLAIGTYGTDPQGKPVDEHQLRFVAAPDGIMGRALTRVERFYLDENVRLSGSHEETLGTGWNAAAILWNGSQSLGWLVADNLLYHKPVSKSALDSLSLYALSVGALLARKQTEVALRESEARYRLLAENITDMVTRTAPDGTFTYVSPSVRTMMGYDPEELMGKSGVHIVHPDDMATVEEAFTNILEQSDQRAVLTYRTRCKDGHYVWTEAVSKPIYSEETGELLEFIVSGRDITERKRAEAMLFEQRDFLQLVIDSVPALIIVKDRAGRFQLVNTLAAHLYGAMPADLVGKTDEEVNSDQDTVTFIQQKDREAFATGQTLYLPEERVLDRYYQTSKIPLRNQDGQYDRLLVVGSDVTQYKKAEEALRQAVEKEKELGDLKTRFVSMASHEFRTPLATILATTDTLSAYRHRLTDEQIEQRLAKIRDQVGHLKDIMDDVLQLARMQARRVEFKPEMLDLDALCREIIEEFQSRPDVRRQFDYTCDNPGRALKLDKKLMRQILSNLISNAVKYSPADKPIRIQLEFTAKTVVWSVLDQGIGIPTSDQKHLFEPFHRAENVGSIPGTGLGLVITKESVEMHGGTITVDTEVDAGTTFTVRIPVVEGVSKS